MNRNHPIPIVLACLVLLAGCRDDRIPEDGSMMIVALSEKDLVSISRGHEHELHLGLPFSIRLVRQWGWKDIPWPDNCDCDDPERKKNQAFWEESLKQPASYLDYAMNEEERL